MTILQKTTIFMTIFKQQFCNMLTYILLFAAIIIMLLGAYSEAIMIISILFSSALLATMHLYRVARSTNLINMAGAAHESIKKNLKQISTFILIFITLVCVGLFMIGFVVGKDLAELLAMLIALFICVVPEGLPVALTLVIICQARRAYKHDQYINYAFRRVVLFFFATNLGEVLIVFGALMMGLQMPFLAKQFLWLNLVTDGFLDTAIAVESVNLEKISNDQTMVLFDRKIIMQILYKAVLMFLVGLFIFVQYYAEDIDKARTLTLLTVVLFQCFNALSCVAPESNSLKINLINSKYLAISISLVIGMQTIMIYVPFLQAIFNTVAISILEYIGAILLASIALFSGYFKKLMRNNYV